MGQHKEKETKPLFKGLQILFAIVLGGLAVSLELAFVGGVLFLIYQGILLLMKMNGA